jgi:hypothetical protein
MSSVALQGNAGGSGAFVVTSPSSNNSRTLTLPDATDTLTGIAATQTLTNKTLTSPTMTTPNIDSAQVATVSGTAPLYMSRAWVNFNGTGTVAIRASGNVTSITDNGTGDYTVNFATAMPDANYSTGGSAIGSTVANSAYVNIKGTTTPTSSAINIQVTDEAGNQIDVSYVNAHFFR